MNRNKKIIKTSAVGAAGNLFLSAFKLAIGIAANSVSIRADAINNTTDALSSIITIIGARLSEKEPDRKHPFGYGRIEYLSSLLIGMLILYAGVGEILSSIRRDQPSGAQRLFFLVAGDRCGGGSGKNMYGPLHHAPWKSPGFRGAARLRERMR